MWPCVQCTFMNSNDSLACEVCYVTDINANPIDVIWEWSPDNERWIPYGKFTCRRIEAAYQSDKPQITLKGGYFATAPDVYKFRLNKTDNCFYQVNTFSRCARPARRRAGPDALVVVDLASVDSQDRCVMCQERCVGDQAVAVAVESAQDEDDDDDDDVYDDEDDEEQQVAGGGADEVVKLARCADGHYFHRGCITGYLLLRNHCPVCFQPATVG
ncbi:hypothetical protein HDU87_005938 [Geranomyces variabilis]|uniref:WWE domain-containing protein n=1 Tax=Geranomyces variabilis TaxID=109894 RepID=A0AAD5TQ33_9FUNG|nr:hypothetical protein HDU87_005938 [Geranomyces variabilis]